MSGVVFGWRNGRIYQGRIPRTAAPQLPPRSLVVIGAARLPHRGRIYLPRPVHIQTDRRSPPLIVHRDDRRRDGWIARTLPARDLALRARPTLLVRRLIMPTPGQIHIGRAARDLAEHVRPPLLIRRVVAPVPGRVYSGKPARDLALTARPPQLVRRALIVVPGTVWVGRPARIVTERRGATLLVTRSGATVARGRVYLGRLPYPAPSPLQRPVAPTLVRGAAQRQAGRVWLPTLRRAAPVVPDSYRRAPIVVRRREERRPGALLRTRGGTFVIPPVVTPPCGVTITSAPVVAALTTAPAHGAISTAPAIALVTMAPAIADLLTAPPRATLMEACDMPATLTQMTRGDTPTWNLAVTNDDGSAFNLTGCTIWFTAKYSPADADPGVFQLSTTGGEIVITNAVGGLATITPLTTSTSGLTQDVVLYWDVQVRTPAPVRTYTVGFGTLGVRRDITRA